MPAVYPTGWPPSNSVSVTMPARGLGGVGRSLPRETRLYEGGLPNQIIEMLAKELIPACAEGSDPAGSSGSWPSNLRTSVGWA